MSEEIAIPEYGAGLNVLVGCEYSGIVRDAFIRAGHYAMSCDILPSESPNGDHWQGDIVNCLMATDEWDLIILHPPCTALCVSGNRWYGRGQPHHGRRKKAGIWTSNLWNLALERSPYVALENPVGVLKDFINAPVQYIQPWQFGHPEFKKTGLWLSKGLPRLRPANPLQPPDSQKEPERYREWQRVWNMPPSATRGKERSRFFSGIGDAMADQWGSMIVSRLGLAA
jgi:hypothetical protein